MAPDRPRCRRPQSPRIAESNRPSNQGFIAKIGQLYLYWKSIAHGVRFQFAVGLRRYPIVPSIQLFTYWLIFEIAFYLFYFAIYLYECELNVFEFGISLYEYGAYLFLFGIQAFLIFF